MASFQNGSSSLDIGKILLGDKWKVNIIIHLYSGPKRYGELLNIDDSITKKVLTENLKELEELDILSRNEEINNNIKNVFYNLTETGVSLIPIINNIIEWCLEYTKKHREDIEK